MPFCSIHGRAIVLGTSAKVRHLTSPQTQDLPTHSPLRSHSLPSPDQSRITRPPFQPNHSATIHQAKGNFLPGTRGRPMDSIPSSEAISPQTRAGHRSVPAAERLQTKTVERATPDIRHPEILEYSRRMSPKNPSKGEARLRVRARARAKAQEYSVKPNSQSIIKTMTAQIYFLLRPLRH